MTTEQQSPAVAETSAAIEDSLVGYLEQRLKTTVAPTDDLFDSGLVTSMFAMELVVHLEQSYAVAIIGPDLKLDNFRTVRAMAGLVLRLRDGGEPQRGV